MASFPTKEDPSVAGDWTIEDAFGETTAAVGEIIDWTKSGALVVWAKTTRRMRAAGGFILFTYVLETISLYVCHTLTLYLFRRLVALSLWRPDQQGYEMPQFSFDYTHGHPVSPFNASKVALLIENRPNPILAPLILHMMSVVPPDWRFRFMGSNTSVAYLNESFAIRNQVEIGKLDLTYIPANMSTNGQEMISRFLTNLWLYETVLQPAEWLLVYQTDSILCANAQQSLNDFLEYDWVGAPWNPSGSFGGNGGLSLRRVSAMISILKYQNRIDGSEPEDVWLSDRLGHRPGAKMANGTSALTFSGEMNSGEAVKVPEKKPGKKKMPSVESHTKNGGSKDKSKPAPKPELVLPPTAEYIKGIDDWRDGHYEPMGYHTGGSGQMLHGGIWGTPEKRKHIWDYCPEVKMTLFMDVARYVPGECGTSWKRDEEGIVNRGYPGMGEVDENGYPYLPELYPW
jgi:hypothetical protein